MPLFAPCFVVAQPSPSGKQATADFNWESGFRRYGSRFDSAVRLLTGTTRGWSGRLPRRVGVHVVAKVIGNVSILHVAGVNHGHADVSLLRRAEKEKKTSRSPHETLPRYVDKPRCDEELGFSKKRLCVNIPLYRYRHLTKSRRVEVWSLNDKVVTNAMYEEFSGNVGIVTR